MKNLNPQLFSIIMIFAGFFMMVSSCGQDKFRKKPNVSHIDINIQLNRFEQDLFSLDTTHIGESLEQLRQKYPMFFQCYFDDIFRLNMRESETYAPMVRELLQYEGMQAAYDSTMLRYSNIDDLENDLNQAFRYYKYYFPDSLIPEFTTFVSEYQFGVITCRDSVIGIGLDLYLGENFEFYAALEIPYFVYRRFNRQHILPNVMMSWARNEWELEPVRNTLLDFMVHNGKLLYFLDLTLPDTPDHLKIGYSEEQFEWSRENEQEMWGFFVERQLLYNSNTFEINRYVGESPSSAGMPPEAPGNTGSWVGWQIVRAYINRFPDTTFEELLQLDGQTILQQSRYKPK